MVDAHLLARHLVGKMLGPLAQAEPLSAPRPCEVRSGVRGSAPLRSSSKATFSTAVSVGSGLKNWKMKPILVATQHP